MSSVTNVCILVGPSHPCSVAGGRLVGRSRQRGHTPNWRQTSRHARYYLVACACRCWNSTLPVCISGPDDLACKVWCDYPLININLIHVNQVLPIIIYLANCYVVNWPLLWFPCPSTTPQLVRAIVLRLSKDDVTVFPWVYTLTGCKGCVVVMVQWSAFRCHKQACT